MEAHSQTKTEQQTGEVTEQITKDMLISEIVGKYPQVAGVIQSYGLHCVGCHVSAYESLEEGCLGHGMDEQEIDNLVKDINTVISKSNKERADRKNNNENKQEVEVTSSAVTKVKELMKKEDKEGYSLRISVVAGGCSGFSYELSFVEKGEDSDLEMVKDNLKIYVDKDSLEYMDGVRIDFVDTLQESGFKIDNPNAKSTCGCGKSFG